MASLSTEQREHFEREGYLIVPDVFDPADLEPLRNELDQKIRELVQEQVAQGVIDNAAEDEPFERQLIRVHEQNEDATKSIFAALEGKLGGGYQGRAMFDLICHPKLLDSVESLVGPEVVASSVYRIRPKLPGSQRGVVPWHQDSGYFMPVCDGNLVLTCWVPFVDANEHNGCMQIIPRAHKQGIYEHYTPSDNSFLILPDESLPNAHAEPIVAECPRGGVVFMTNMTPHCSTWNHSEGIRWSVDLRYQSAMTPTNVELPQPDGKVDVDADQRYAIACYPPEADFVVRSADASRVVDFDGYRSRRVAFESAEINVFRQWPKLEEASA